MAEPANWAIQHTMLDQEPFGSFYHNAHEVDVTFGDLAVTQLRQGDILSVQDHLSTLLAAEPDAGAPSGSGAAAAASEGSVPNLSSLGVQADDPAVTA